MIMAGKLCMYVYVCVYIYMHFPPLLMENKLDIVPLNTSEWIS